MYSHSNFSHLDFFLYTFYYLFFKILFNHSYTDKLKFNVNPNIIVYKEQTLNQVQLQK